MRILVAEQNVAAAHRICQILSRAGFVIDHVSLGDEAVEMACHFDYDVVLLDRELPEVNGIEVLRQMRRVHRGAPVLMLNSGKTITPATALNAGADDVASTDMDQDELLARVHALARRGRGCASSQITVAGLVVNLEAQELTYNGKPIRLTAKEFAVLELLVLRRGMALSKDVFLNHLYAGMDEPDMKIIDVFICKLRKKLQNVGISNLIITVWGRGYMLKEASATVIPMPISDVLIVA